MFFAMDQHYSGGSLLGQLYRVVEYPYRAAEFLVLSTPYSVLFNA